MKHWWHQDALDEWRYYSPPDPFLESSDGRVWFRIDRSGDWHTLRSGIAWFNPATREGCWFTNEGTQIQEDPQQNLWMVINDTLYKYDLVKD
jgi:hypothetical protein